MTLAFQPFCRCRSVDGRRRKPTAGVQIPVGAYRLMLMRKARPKKSWVKQLASDRIGRLLGLARARLGARPDLTKRYVRLALLLSKRYNVGIGPEKKHICRRCGTYLVEGRNLQVRASPKHRAIAYKCLECGNIQRFPYNAKVFIKERTKSSVN